jgi:hypothetical protein
MHLKIVHIDNLKREKNVRSGYIRSMTRSLGLTTDRTNLSRIESESKRIFGVINGMAAAAAAARLMRI